MKAIWNGKVLASSEQTVIVEGNHYFPIQDVDLTYFEKNDEHTTCAWKGIASYYDIVVDGKRNKSAAWYYPDPKPEAEMVRDRIAFWKGVEVK